jgi:Tripartite tricarboxylate transporter family receptor
MGAGERPGFRAKLSQSTCQGHRAFRGGWWCRYCGAPDFSKTLSSLRSVLRGRKAWHAVLAPTKTPPDIIKKLNIELAAILSETEVRERLAKDGIETVGASPEEFGAYIKSEVEKWGKVVREAGIKLE